MATFAARGFLRFDGVVPEEINEQFLAEIADVLTGEVASPEAHYGRVMQLGSVPLVPAGTSLANAYPAESVISQLLALPVVAGATQSLVGSKPVLDHHFLHITFPPTYYKRGALAAQHIHQDSTIDPRRAFDIQLMYFPHEVTLEMGGTRFIPGSHLRRVSEASIGRYQNVLGQQHVVCPAGTLLIMHMGIWHGGGSNLSEKLRYMFKVRLCPIEKQVRLWDFSDLPDDHLQQRPIFWIGNGRKSDHIHTILTEPEPWFEFDTSRLEYINRIKFWRYLLGDQTFDADYWLTRLENEFE
jgi:hypothetical protein